MRRCIFAMFVRSFVRASVHSFCSSSRGICITKGMYDDESGDWCAWCLHISSCLLESINQNNNTKLVAFSFSLFSPYFIFESECIACVQYVSNENEDAEQWKMGATITSHTCVNYMYTATNSWNNIHFVLHRTKTSINSTLLCIICSSCCARVSKLSRIHVEKKKTISVCRPFITPNINDKTWHIFVIYNLKIRVI